MKIRVTTDKHDYQGLCYDSIIDNVDTSFVDGVWSASFKLNGKHWVLPYNEYIGVDTGDYSEAKTPIKSDGGSSSYYDFKIPEHYLELIKETGVIKTEYLIDIIFANDFDFACTFKALVRAKGITEGAGKEGNTLDYELNKMEYYEARIKEKYNWRENE